MDKILINIPELDWSEMEEAKNRYSENRENNRNILQEALNNMNDVVYEESKNTKEFEEMNRLLDSMM